MLPLLGGGIDAVVTDPPYGIAFAHGAGGDGIGGGKYVSKFNGVAIAGDDRPFDPSALLGLAKTIVLFGANHFAERLPSSSKWLVWDKRKGFTRNDFADCEMAWTNLKGVARLINHYWNGMMRDSEKGIPRVHPTQKPVAVMEWVLGEATAPNEAVLDPFMGSGTTGVACVKLGRKFIGIEIDEGYFDIACERIRKAYAQPDMFVTPERPPEPTQEALEL
ncbi:MULTISPECIES: site-specific DNA-methyltransferase [unclassified Mesorhizobium]|uniref:DNA-methyltransferase n=1 Tax=unclassified Mesorhizobium TaxID=325217 RepID=UPI001AEE4631|nr:MULTISPECIES: site-specific DNA-methyltransferase [unclassified Mesorhizobium]